MNKEVILQSQPVIPQETPQQKNEYIKQKGADKKYILGGFLVGLLIVGVTFTLLHTQGKGFWNKDGSVFNKLGGTENKENNPALIKSVQNPLTGVMYTPTESADWVDRRPLGIMINNHPDARPQAGLIDADFTYEMVAEGGITRFITFFLTNLPNKVGPIRSTREYHLVLVKEMGDAMFMHHGYSPQALVAIESWPVRSLQRGAAPYWRENPRNVAIEHTLYASAKEIVDTGLSLGWQGRDPDFYVWQFKDNGTLYSSSPSAATISYDFWYSGDFSAVWHYDPSTNSYLRYMGYDEQDKELPHLDEGSGKQISVSNVIIQFATESSIVGDDKNRLEYALVGSGKGYVFLDGKEIEATWSKAGRDSRTMYYDTNGEEIKFNRGKFWVSILPDRNMDYLKFSAPVD